MSSGITLTAATRQNLLSLQGTADLLTQTQNRLSTGKKVNSALDDPTSFFTSQSLTGRSGDLGALLNGISNGVQTIQAANQGITSIQKLVDSAKSTANQALADKSAISSGKAANAATVAGSKSFQGLAGTADGTQDFSALNKDGSIDVTLGAGATAKTATIRLDSAALKGSVSDLTKVSAEQVVSAVNSQISNNADLKGKVSASVGSDGRISFATTSAGASQQLTIAGSKSSTLDIGFGKATNSKAATVTAQAALDANESFANGSSASFTVNDGSKAVSIKVDANSAIDDQGNKVGDSGTRDEVLAAINKQLKDAGSAVKAGLDGSNNLTFTSEDVGPDAQLTVTASSGGANIGFGGTFTAVPPTAGGASGAYTVTGAATVATPNLDFSNGKTAQFSVTAAGGSKVNVSLSSASLDTAGNPIGAAAPQAKVVEAINRQLAAGGNTTTTASITGNALIFTDTSTTAGPTIAFGNDTVGLGYGATAAATQGVFSAGTGNAPLGITATGSDATDGSAKATFTGTGTVPTTTDFSTPKDASFTIKLGDGAAKKIVLNNTTLDSTASPSEIADAINAQFKADTGLSGKVEAKIDDTGKLQISSTDVGAKQTITLQAAQITTGANEIDIGLGKVSLASAAVTKVGSDSSGSTNSTRQTLAKQFNEILNQITQQAKDSSYNGINLLYRSGDDASENSLKVTFNETGSSSLSIAGAKLDADGIGLTSVTGGFQTDDEINKTLTAITSATSQLRAQSSTFGSNLSIVQNRQDFSKNLINILDTGAANLTNADLNEEAANSQALSTRQSIGISALSLANTAQQGILQLLR